MTARRRKYEGDPEAAATQVCAWPGCEAPAPHKAPRSKDALRSYIWFCLDHVRDYNKSWNFYDGMSDDEVEAAVRSDTTWNRPTWPLGDPGDNYLGGDEAAEKIRVFQASFANMRDPFDLFEDTAGQRIPPELGLSDNERKAVRLLSLEVPFTTAEVKARYKVLVKRFHPDANGGDRAAEEKFKEINEAYETVMKFLDA